MLSFANAKASLNQRTTAGAITLALTVMLVVVFPFAHHALGDITSIAPLVGGLTFSAELLTAYLLFSQYVSNRLLPLAILGSAYLFVALLMIPELLAFPGIATAHGLGAGLQAAMWFRAIRTTVFPALTLVYLIAEKRFPARSEAHERSSYLRPILLTVTALAGGLTAFVFTHAAHMPTLAWGTTRIGGWGSGVWESVIALAAGVLALTLVATGGKTVTQLWLMVALLACCCEVTVTAVAQSRFTLAWYASLFDSLVTAFAILTIFLAEIHTMYDRLTQMATIDGLTGVGNRRMFEDRFDSAYRHAIRAHRPLGLLMMDVDFFKRYNDACGHLAGDDCLRSLATAARLALTRSLDTIVRYGGEEFAVILPETDSPGAEVVAERIRHRVSWLEIPHPASPVSCSVTVSIGVTSLVPDSGETISEVIARADAALYRAKALGRNRVVVVDRPAAPQIVQLA